MSRTAKAAAVVAAALLVVWALAALFPGEPGETLATGVPDSADPGTKLGPGTKNEVNVRAPDEPERAARRTTSGSTAWTHAGLTIFTNSR